MRSNASDDAMAALQLLSHLEGDALNVALLVPEARRATRVGLVGTLTERYGSPGRLADYRRQFERMTHTAGEDPSIFGIELEKLAVKSFGDMGQTARLCIIRDRFIAGHDSCELRRHLDSVSPETPIHDIVDSIPPPRDIVDHCWVWESHADSRRFSKLGPDRTLPIYTVDTLSEEMDYQVVAAVTTTQPESDQLEILLRRLLSGPVVPAPLPEPVPSVLEQLLQRLLTEAQAPWPTPPAQAGHLDIESLLRNLLPSTSAPAAWVQQGPMRRNWNTVVCFSCGKAGHGAPVP